MLKSYNPALDSGKHHVVEATYMEVTKSLYNRGIMLEPSKYGTLGAFWAKTNT